MAAAAGALVVDDPRISAAGVPVNGMVDGAVADARLLHTPDDFLKGVQILQRVSFPEGSLGSASTFRDVLAKIQKERILEKEDGRDVPYLFR